MSNFEKAYSGLNSQQKLAVDTIDGPVLVIAGPGTGKTQLLSVRVANILDKTDAQPDNILCLTFTDAAATEMRERLVKLIGQAGYDINVMTFHAFGTDIINRFPDYFYQGASMRAIDEISSFEIFTDIFKGLSHSNALASQNGDEFTYLKDSQNAIKQLKKSATSPDELREKLKQQQEFIDIAEPIIVEAFGSSRLSKKVLPKLEEALEDLRANPKVEPSFIVSLESALEQGTTPPVSAWKRQWLTKDQSGQVILKDRAKIVKLSALADVYEQYQKKLAKVDWYDYEDMVMQAVQKLQQHTELQAELQEQYQYLLVDEFQDTNDAQLKLVQLMADNPVNEGRPNILVVGDDDQAIYKFQGAEVTNMHSLASWVNQLEVIPLSKIYRYPKPLLDLSSQVISHTTIRLKDDLAQAGQTLESVPDHNFKIKRLSYENEFVEYDQIAKSIAAEIKAGSSAKSIAVIGRNHSHLQAFAEYAANAEVPVKYDRKDNVLEQPLIKELIHFSRTVVAIADNKRKLVNQLMPELLSYKFWQIEPSELWELNKSIASKDETWMDAMLDNEKFSSIANYLLQIAQLINVDPLNIPLHQMITSPESHFYKYYFDLENNQISQKYLSLLSSLETLRQKVLSFGGEDSSLRDLLRCVDLMKQARINLTSNHQVVSNANAVCLLSAHNAKGLEFDHVYVLHCQEGIWSKSRHSSNKLGWTSNMQIAPAGDEHDDRVRLFYVAVTRAKHSLILSSSASFASKASLQLRFLENTVEEEVIKTPPQEAVLASVLDWTTDHILQAESNPELLRPYLDDYRLSISHLQNFVNVASGGPNNWLMFNLLRFPGPSIPVANYGTAIHATLSEAQKYFQAKSKPKPVKDLLLDFEKCLKQMQLSASDHKLYLNRGQQALQKFFEAKYASFKTEDKSEVSFFGDNIVIGNAKITGQADRVNLIHGNWQIGKIEVVDYKTGKASQSWQGRTPYEKAKLYRYKQQLLFYELMLKSSKRFKNLNIVSSKLEFVESNYDGSFSELASVHDEEDMERLKKLIQAVWQKMQTLDLPDISEYSSDVKGIIAFEDDLIESTNS